MSTTVVKTSESPPPQLRAAVVRDDEAFRDVPFQRNRVRASMSDMKNGNSVTYRGGDEENFPRNSRYRSTMGAAMPSTSYSMKQGWERGISFNGENNFYIYFFLLFPCSSSQLSVRSTNPFDEDMDDDMISVSGYSVASMPNRPYRKKRRAPMPPPAGSNKTDDDKASVSVTEEWIVCGCD